MLWLINVIFECRFQGNAKLAPSDRIVYTSKEDDVYTLTIRDTKKEEAGMFTVKAINDIGDVSASARLKVTRKYL